MSLDATQIESTFEASSASSRLRKVEAAIADSRTA